MYICLFLHQTTTKINITRPAKKLYIYLFLHQTTTPCMMISAQYRCISIYSYIKPQQDYAVSCSSTSCISIYSYIKPQPDTVSTLLIVRCISIYSYIKPQLVEGAATTCPAVYLSIPTSNHNV